jgi:hypothetical protein
VGEIIVVITAAKSTPSRHFIHFIFGAPLKSPLVVVRYLNL